MAGSLRDRLREMKEEKDRWFRERNAQASRLKQDLEYAGREAWNEATRVGVNLVARTPQELQALGARVLDAGKQAGAAARSAGLKTSGGPPEVQPRAAAAPSKPRPAKPFAAAGLREAALQVDTAVGTAADLLTFGLADRLEAGWGALVQPGGVRGLRQRYESNFAQGRYRDRYDAAHRAIAQAAGQVGGTLLGLRLVGPTGGSAAAAPRLPSAAALTGREAVALLGGGAATGLGAQVASDIAAGGRRSSLGDNLGAATGGIAGVAALPLGPARAGAVEAWVTSAAQDAFNGRPVSIGRAGESAIAGNLMGGLAGKVGTSGSNGLSPQAKGRLGEAMGDIRSTVNGQRREWAPKARDYIGEDDYWYPDARNGSMRFEDKFGFGAAPTPNQTRAQTVLGPDFQLYHFTPDDIGRLVSVPAAAAAPHLVNEPRRQP